MLGVGDKRGLIASTCEDDNKKTNETSFQTNGGGCSNYDCESMIYELNDLNYYLLTFFNDRCRIEVELCLRAIE